MLGLVRTRDYYISVASVEDDRSAANQVAERYSWPATVLGVRAEYRPPLGESVELRLGGDWRETEGRTQERFFFVDGVGTRGRIAGGRTRTLGGFAEIGWEEGPRTLTGGRSDERRVGQGCVSTSRSRWSQKHEKKKITYSTTIN